MSYDGKALFLARKAIRELKQNNEAEQQRRRTEAFASEPRLAQLDAEMTRLMTSLALSALKNGNDVEAAVRHAKDESSEIIRRRDQLLRQHNLPGNYLDEIYSCPKCRDLGYVNDKMCTCLESAYRREANRQLTSMLSIGTQCFENFDLSLYEPMGTGGTNPRAEMDEIRAMCQHYATDFGDSSVNLLFRGGTGLGKTFLSACIAKVVAEKGFSVVYDTCVSVIDAFETQKFERGAEGTAESSSQIKRYLNCDLLILDDLGTEMTTSFTQSALYTLINSRLINGKKTIVSTNLSDEELTRRYTPQIVSRLRGEYMLLQFYGRDIREVKKERGV